MARLSHPPDPFHTTPASKRISTAIADSHRDMPFSPLTRTISREKLHPHGNDALPASSPSQGSKRSSLSPADCRTLDKILRDVASPPATPSPLEQNDRLFLAGSRTDGTEATGGEDGRHLISGEAADTGYEDEADSMELSEGGEVDTAQKSVTSLGGPTSPSITKSDRRLQESVSVHDAKDKLRLKDGHRSYTTKRVKAKRPEQRYIESPEATDGDIIEDVLNISGKRTPPKCRSGLLRGDSDGQTVFDETNQLDRKRRLLEKVLKEEQMEQELSEGEDNEKTQSRINPGVSEVPRRKTPQGAASVSGSSTESPEMGKGIAMLVPSTPASATHTTEPAHVHFSTTQSVPETPFTKTLMYFKQYKDIEKSPTKLRRTTALPPERSEVIENVVHTGAETADLGCVDAQAVVADAGLPTVKSALVDLEGMAQGLEVVAQLDDNVAVAKAISPVDQELDQVQPIRSNEGSSENSVIEGDAVADSSCDDAQKQLILYPQHPPFVNAIGMIPATMFWATAAPVVKYTSIAIELLIDKLRDTYL